MSILQRVLRQRGVVVFIAAVLAAISFSSVPGSHLADADGYLVHVSAIAGFDRVGIATVFSELAAHENAENPGWFPLAATPLAVWLMDPPVTAVKDLQYLLIVLSFALFGDVARRLLGSPEAALVAVVLALCALQFRMPHDPVVGTSLLVPWLACLVLVSFSGWLRFRDTGAVGALGVTVLGLSIALLTGPIAWGLGALLALAALFSRGRGPMVAIGLAVIVAASIGISVVRGLPAAPWQHGGTYAANVLAQLFAALPTSFRAVGNLPMGHVPALYFAGSKYVDDRFILIPGIVRWEWVAIVASTAVAFWALTVGPRSVAVRLSFEGVLVGVGFLLLPALALGPSRWWPHGLPFGQAFDGVYFEYFGLALIMTWAMFRGLREQSVRTRLIPSLVAVAVFVTCYGNVRANAVVLARSARIDGPRTLVQRAGTAGFFGSIPPGSTVAVAASLAFADGIHGSVSDAKYALFHYSGRRFDVIPASSEILGSSKSSVWLLSTQRPRGILVSLSHLVGRGAFLTDHAYGFTPFADAVAEAMGPKHGLEITATPVAGGDIIEARRTCGSVRFDSAFIPDRPRLVWGRGFFAQGPQGYALPPLKRTLLGDVLTYPKEFMTSRGVLSIYPTTCPGGPKPVTLNAIAVAASAANVTIYSQRSVDRVAVSAAVTPFALRYVDWRSPIRVVFRTDAPSADLDPIEFRYERDVPRDVRLVVEVSDVREER